LNRVFSCSRTLFLSDASLAQENHLFGFPELIDPPVEALPQQSPESQVLLTFPLFKRAAGEGDLAPHLWKQALLKGIHLARGERQCLAQMSQHQLTWRRLQQKAGEDFELGGRLSSRRAGQAGRRRASPHGAPQHRAVRDLRDGNSPDLCRPDIHCNVPGRPAHRAQTRITVKGERAQKGGISAPRPIVIGTMLGEEERDRLITTGQGVSRTVPGSPTLPSISKRVPSMRRTT